MSSRSKKEMSSSEKEQFLAEMVVKAVRNFEHLGITINDIGIPPMTADQKMCSGHSWKDFCTVCRFNFCWKCGGPIRNLCYQNNIKCWTGLCGYTHGEDANPSVEHHERVLAIAKRMIEEQKAEAARKVSAISKRMIEEHKAEAARKEGGRAKVRKVADDASAPPLGSGGGWAGDSRIGQKVGDFQASVSKVPRIQVSKPPPARKSTAAPSSAAQVVAPAIAVAQPQLAVAQPLSAAQAIAQGVQPGSAAQAIAVAPQINIAIAPLAEVRVESTNTTVRRIGDGAMGNIRFEVTVNVVLEQVIGQQQAAV